MSNPDNPSRQAPLGWRTLERWGMPRSGSLQPRGRKLPHHHFARPLYYCSC